MTSILAKDFNLDNFVEKPFIYNIEVIFQGITTILTTLLFLRLFMNQFGSLLLEMPFEYTDEDSADEIYTVAVDAIEAWNPRVIFDLGSSSVEALPDDNKFRVDFWFTLKGEYSQQYNYKKTFRVV